MINKLEIQCYALHLTKFLMFETDMLVVCDYNFLEIVNLENYLILGQPLLSKSSISVAVSGEALVTWGTTA